MALTHEGGACVGHDGFDISEIDIHQTWYGDDVGDTADTLSQDVISNSESFSDGEIWVDTIQETIIGNDDKGVDSRAEGFNGVDGLLPAEAAFKGEGGGDNGDGQDAH